MTKLHGPKHVFSVQPAPPFLTEELALAKARETLTKEGYSASDWQLTTLDKVGITPQKAPDGTTDKYFLRESYEPFRGNRGQVTFNMGGRYRAYLVRLEGNRVICSAFHGLIFGGYKSE